MCSLSQRPNLQVHEFFCVVEIHDEAANIGSFSVEFRRSHKSTVLTFETGEYITA
jgi:ferredoxin-NADP reductase